MRTPVHANIISNNLVELHVVGEKARYALHGDVPEILRKDNLELISVWQMIKTGGIEGCWKDRFYQWLTPPADFVEALAQISHYQKDINSDRSLRHYTALQILSFGGFTPNINPLILEGSIMDKFRMFLDGSWMVNPHIPTSTPDIIRSLKEFALLPGEDNYTQSVCRLTQADTEVVHTFMEEDGPLTHDLALRLAAITGMGPEWWVNKDYSYRNAVFENDINRQLAMLSLGRGITL